MMNIEQKPLNPEPLNLEYRHYIIPIGKKPQIY